MSTTATPSLQLSQADLIKVGAISSRDTLQVLPVSKHKKKQKFVIGDDEGNIGVYQLKKGDPSNSFTAQSKSGAPITSVRMGGILEDTEKIFFSSKQTIEGYTKKGKEFYSFESNVSENINAIVTDNQRLWSTTDYTYTQYDDGKEVQSYMAQDKINALSVEKMSNDTHYEALLACQDKTIRLIKDSEMIMKKSVSGPALSFAKDLSIDTATHVRNVIYGTAKGSVGQLLASSSKLKSGWKIDKKSNSSAVNSIFLYDVNLDGTLNTIVGRDNGQVQVYDHQQNNSSSPSLIFEEVESESIRGVKGAIISSPEYEEVLACTYSGRVVSYTTEKLGTADMDDSYGRSRGTVMRETRIVKLRKEIGKMKERIEREKEKFAKQPGMCNPIADNFSMSQNFVLEPEVAAYDLTVEIASPIDVVVLHTTLPVELLDSSQNSAILSVTKNDETGVTATYRCNESGGGVNRLTIRLRTTEGQFGDISALVVASVSPKSAQALKFNVKPLSLHYRLNEEPSTVEKFDKTLMNTLTFTGSMTVSQIHDWVSICLPEVPRKFADTTDATLYYRNAFTKSLLKLSYRKGELILYSDSISALAICREVLTREATSRNVSVNMSFSIEDETIMSYLKLLKPKLDEKHSLACNINLMDAIKEIQMQEDDSELWMSAEYQDIMKNASAIKQEFKARPGALRYLAGVVTDFYMDISKFRGAHVQNRIPRLHQLLDNYEFENLAEFFMERM